MDSSYFSISPHSFSISSEISSFRPINYPENSSNSSSVDRYPCRSDRCLICTDRSSGIHFGVSTCEACKAFFRRTSLSSYSIPPPCSPNRCEINLKSRNNCPSCRFDKCKRLGMDRDNVIYGKPSKQQNHSNYLIEQLTNISNELIQNIHSINNKQQIDTFGNIAFQLFYEQTYNNNNSSEIIHRIFHLIFDSSNFLSNYDLNIRIILSLWLFVYYYETFFFKQKISQDKLTILIKLLDMQSNQIPQYYGEDQHKQYLFRIDFINTFTKFAEFLQEIYSDH